MFIFSLIQEDQDLLQQAIVEADIDADIYTDSQQDLEPPDTSQLDLEPPVVITSPEGFEIRQHEEQDQDEDQDEDAGVRKHLNYS